METASRKLAPGRTLDDFLAALCRGRELYALEAGEDGQFHLVRAGSWQAGRHELGAYRPVEPLKTLFFQPREYLGRTMQDDGSPELPERIVIGAKNCDLSGLVVQDHVFLGLSPQDPRYQEAREKTLLVSADCTDCLDVCFCPVMGEQPYAKGGYDINLATVDREVVIDAGSEKGERLLEEVGEFLQPAEAELLERRARQRDGMTRRLVEQAAEHGLRPGLDLKGAIRGARDSKLWADFAVDCVECGACNFTCCTCHCFLLADGLVEDGEPGRGKQWDSCLLMRFARVAGGENPRAGRAARLRNRFHKKFSYFPDALGRYACDGCGRCTEVCTGDIDIRAILKRAVDEAQSVPADHGND